MFKSAADQTNFWQAGAMSPLQKEMMELELAMRENEEMDSRLAEQATRLDETKKRQQDLMDSMANRIDRLYSRWQQLQDSQQQQLQASYNFASQKLPRGGKKMLTPEEARVMKLQLEVVENKVALLTTLDKTGQGMHKRVSRNGHKLQEVATKAREVEARLKKLVEGLKNSANPQDEAKKILLGEIAKLEKIEEGPKRENALQLATALKQFVKKVTDEKSATSLGQKAISGEALMNGEIVASKPAQPPVATDSLTNANEEQKQQ